MGLISFLLLGLIAGSIAKRILKDQGGGSWVATMLLGAAGAIVGGWLGGELFGVSLRSFFSLTTWLLAIGGSVLVLFVYSLITGRK
ncbi:MAG: GlsB/YeaQ/YmgE family stress response membrane protein [Propionibacteriaceae bacterium]|uniref:Transglycosylase associated protein n=1 Tax=Propionibacterium ruminifibrarum TaxID=1962131 RepID=A0A375I876_9ACTN|nr:GlsB/YeaQ/YmgE family stress response membrane protein [Propionibacterium ruminifibrarum]MBE6478076.1 GlsB/YeaQ/YmgE family stress response membrane protein [Propionibacteriaceae bacterium]SPF69512.1 Transglycosylase associated protein [Propionibacterium ruminifibrarum]